MYNFTKFHHGSLNSEFWLWLHWKVKFERTTQENGKSVVSHFSIFLSVFIICSWRIQKFRNKEIVHKFLGNSFITTNCKQIYCNFLSITSLLTLKCRKQTNKQNKKLLNVFRVKSFRILHPYFLSFWGFLKQLFECYWTEHSKRRYWHHIEMCKERSFAKWKFRQ